MRKVLLIEPEFNPVNQLSLVSNLPPITPSPTSGLGISNNQWLGVRFTTNNEIYLNSATLFLGRITNGPLFLKLYNEINGGFGTEIISFTVPNIQSTTQHLFTAPNLLFLESNTTYWLVAGILNNSGSYVWTQTSSTTKTVLPGWSSSNTGFFSTNQGVSWNSLAQGGIFQFRINGYQRLGIEDIL